MIVVMDITCGGCDVTWTGIGRAHCPTCHRTFAGPTLFDAHRRGTRSHGYCLHPSEVIASGEPLRIVDGIWRTREMDSATRARRFGLIR